MSGRAPRREVRRQWRWPELGACGDGGYGTGTSRRGGGKRRSPHSGVVEQLGRLGEALFGANRRRGSMVAGEEDDDADGDAMRLAHVARQEGRGHQGDSSGSNYEARGWRWTRQQRAAATSSARARAGREQRRGGARRVREGSGGRVALSRAVQGEQAGWRWPGTCRRASATRAPVLLA